MTLYKSRFSEKVTDVMARLNNSLSVDIVLLPYDVKLNEAWAEELRLLNICTDEELAKIKKGLAQIKKEWDRGEFKVLPNEEDVHTLVEKRLVEIAGECGKKIHTGKSRNDQVVTDLKMYLKEAVSTLDKKISELINVIVRTAEKNIETVMPGYTHLKQAQPVSLAHYLLSFAFALKEDTERLCSYEKNNLAKCVLGSGAIAGTTLKVDRERLAKRLGFEAASENSILSISDRAFVVELSSHLSIIAMHLSRHAEDLIIWNSDEFGFIELSDSVSTGSSMMPQKKNPDSLEIIRGAAGVVYGRLVSILTITKGLPSSYNKDLQFDKKSLFESIELVMDSLTLFKEVIQTATFNVERMRNAVNRDTLATDLADILIKKGMAFRDAHDEVASLVRQMHAEKIAWDELTKEKLIDIHSSISIKDLNELSIDASIERRSAKGGTSLGSLRAQIKFLKM